MAPDQIKTIVYTAIKEGPLFMWWPYLLFVILAGVGSYCGAYLTSKGQRMAIKETTARVVHLEESVKAQFRTDEAVAEAKRRMQYEASLEALNVVDSFLSHFIENPFRPTPQRMDISRAREAQSKLILSCKNPRVTQLFTEILCGPDLGDRKRPPTDLLNEFRNLLRQELGFGEHIELDRNRAWYGKLPGDSIPLPSSEVPMAGSKSG